MKRRFTTSDAHKAAELFAGELSANRGTMIVEGRTYQLGAVSRVICKASDKKKARLGRRLLAQYVGETNCEGRIIDWDAFHAWLKEHMPELTAMKIILSIISILLIL